MAAGREKDTRGTGCTRSSDKQGVCWQGTTGCGQGGGGGGGEAAAAAAAAAAGGKQSHRDQATRTSDATGSH
ncbi:hypothetical protein CBS101457_006907 [Exobasidium rhododendri]|nr:hypothetical protein CBS101457_006907 [Exobasidium rhododendri]